MIHDDRTLRIRIKEALDNLWSRIRSQFDGLDARVKELEESGGTPGPQGPPGPAARA